VVSIQRAIANNSPCSGSISFSYFFRFSRRIVVPPQAAIVAHKALTPLMGRKQT
jgi:hypothetical protein